MLRRCLLLVVALPLFADERQQLTDWLGQVAFDLGEGGTGAFMRAFDRSMKGRETLERNVVAIVQSAEVASSAEIQSVDGKDDARVLIVDWFLRLSPRAIGAEAEERRQTLTIKLIKQKKGWRIVEMTPLDLFRPPQSR